MRSASFALALAVSLVACHHDKPAVTTAPPDARSLFERLGGQPAINAVVHEFVQTTAADQRINMFFLNTDKAKLEAAMDDHVCSITGGGCQYKGKPMLEAHTNMHVTPAAFDAFMEDLKTVLVKLKVGDREQTEVIGAFNGLRDQVVNH